MYIDTSRLTRGGKTSTRPLLRASYRAHGKVLHRPIAHVSHGSEAEIEALRLALRHKAALEHLGTIPDAITLQPGMSFGAVWTVYHSARRLGIARALGTTRAGNRARWQGIARVIDPGARLSAVRLAMAHAACDVLGLDACDEEALDENLDGLAGVQGSIEDRLFAPRIKTTPVNLFVSDVTRSSREGTHNDLAACGSNRDGNKGTLQMVLGLLCDEDGHPVSIAVLPGHTPDPHPCAAQLELVKTSFGVTALTLVGDRGMSKGQQVEDLATRGCHDITALTTPQMEKLRRTGVFHMDLCDQEVAEVLAAAGRRYGWRRNPVRAQAMRATRHAKLATLQAQVATQPPYRTDHPRANAQRALQKRVAKADTLRLAAWVELTVAERSITLAIHEDAQPAAANLAGCYGLTTDLTPQQAPTELVHDRYPDLAAGEPAFRTCKTAPRAVRPSCVRRAARTRAHAFVVRLAYPIIHELTACWSPFDITVEEGLHPLTPLCLVEVAPQHAASSHWIPTPRDAIARLLHRADIKLPKAFSLSGTRVSTKNKRQSERLVQ